MPAYDLHGFYQIDTARGGQRYYPGGVITSDWSISTVTLTADLVYAVPLLSTRGATVAGLHIYTDTIAAGKLGRLGIYKADNLPTTNYPVSLVVDGGEFTTDAAGLKTRVVSVALDPDQLYWIAVVFNWNIQVKAIPEYSAWAINGKNDMTTTNKPSSHWRATLAYGALPATFPVAGQTAMETVLPMIAATWS